MNLSSLSIVRPVMTTLIMAAIILFGVLGYTSLPISNLPNVDFPTILVTSNLPGASAETMASAISIPLEKQFASIAGLDQMTSTSTLGQSQVTLQFDPQRNMDGAALDVQAAITAASRQLPPQMTVPPTFAKVNPASQPVLYLAVSSTTLPMHQVDYYAQTLIGQRISRIAGVAQVQVNGAQTYAVRVQVNPQRLASYGLGIDEVMTAVTAANQNQPTGILWGKTQAFTIQSSGQLLDANAYRSVIIASRDGNPIRLGDVASVIDSVQNDKAAGRFNNKPAVILAVLRQPGANTIQVVNDIKQLLPNFRELAPKSIAIDVLYDQSTAIRESVNDVQATLLLTVALVVLVIYLFLGNLSATVIPSLALPISIIGTFAVMQLCHFSLNVLTLMALSLSVGFVVDDAIVMLENIVRHMEMGKTARQAALDGSKEIGFTILSMTLSLVAVFIPVLLLPGIVGRLFNEFSVTISVAILISGFVSLTFTPMLCSRFLKPANPNAVKPPILEKSEAAFNWMVSNYKTTLRYALRHKQMVLNIFFAMLVVTGLLFVFMPKGFMPSEDANQILIMTEAAQGTSFDEMVNKHKVLCRIIQENKAVQSVMSSIGIGNGSPNISLNQGRILVVLKPRDSRDMGAEQIIEHLIPELKQVAGISCYLQVPPMVTIGGQVTKSIYQYTLSSPDSKELYVAARKLEQHIKEIPGVVDVGSDLQVNNPEVHVLVNRDKCAALGVTVQQVEDLLNNAYAARQISTMYTPTNQYWVIIEVEPRYYRDPSLLHTLYIHTSDGSLVPLDTLCKIELGVGPLLVNHVSQFPSVTLSFNLKPGASLGDVTTRIRELANEIVPASITTSFQGSAHEFESSLKNLWVLLALAVIVIYIVLGILYESYTHPVTILSGLPPAGLGALLILMLFGIDLNIYGFLGLIMLIGIVKKNAIMMIDFALDSQRNRGTGAEEAIFEAAITRFRPIMMTTMAALMGGLPIAIGLGAGAEARQPLGLTIVGGLLVSQLVTLYITPVFYIYFDKLQKHVSSKFQESVEPT